MRKLSDDDDKPSPKNRYGRDELLVALREVRERTDREVEFPQEFDPHLPDEDLAPGLAELFERSGLDYTAPGHWQTLLVTISNAIHPSWDGPKIRWAVWRVPFMNRISELHKQYPGLTRLQLCEKFKAERPSDEHWAAADTLRQKVEAILGSARTKKESDQASEEELRWLRELDDA